MTQHDSPYAGMFSAAKNQYHGMKSVAENGAIEHGKKVAEILLRTGMATSQQDAFSLANREIQRLQENVDDLQLNRMARDELAEERKQMRHSPHPLPI